MVLKTAKSSVDDNRKKPETPQIEIFNKGNADKYVNGIELTFDSYFTLYGIVEIIIGDRRILYDNDSQDFKQYRVFSVPTNSQILKRDESIKIFVWNPLTDDIVILAANVDIGYTASPSTLSGQAIDNDAILSEISGGAGNEADTHDIFPYKTYKNETSEFLINTKGRKNMLLTIASNKIDVNLISSDWGNGGNIVDGDLTSISSQLSLARNINPVTTIVDFLSVQSRDIKAKIQTKACNNTHVSLYRRYDKRLFISNDGINFIQIHNQTRKKFGNDIDIFTANAGIHTCRYVKLEIIKADDGNRNYRGNVCISIYQVYDGFISGGTASLEFQLKGVNNQWFVILDSSQLDAVTQGQSKIIQYNIAGIPPSQNRFKAVLKVNGALNTGVTIDLVA